MSEETDYLDIYSVDPGIENMACVRVKVFTNGMAEIVSSIESVIKEKEDETKPGELIKKHKTLYPNYISKVIYRNIFTEHGIGPREFLRDNDPKKLIVLEENDNKYTRHISPALLGMLTTRKPDILIHMVKPKSVYSSMKRDMGWDKTMIGLNREKKKKLTRRFISSRLTDNNYYSDDINDAVLNALFIAKRLKFYKNKKK